MKRLTMLTCIGLMLLTATGCGATITINPTAVSGAQTVVATAPAPVATAISGGATAVANVTVPPAIPTLLSTLPPVTVHPITPLPPEVASSVITIYARHQLGLDVKILKAVGAEGEFNLPETTQANVKAALDLAGTSYAALLEGGVCIVALGGGQVSGDATAAIDWASLGVFSLRSMAPYPTDADTALALVKSTYPGLAGYTFEPRLTERGYGFIATTSTSAVDPVTGEVQTVAKVVIAGVMQTEPGGLVFVHAIVGNGSLSQPLMR